MEEFCPTFTFKEFAIDDRQSALKVGTDGVLLGAWAEPSAGCKTMLDVGAGSGLIALMLAQRFPSVQITAVEVDPPSARDCSKNVEHSPFARQINVIQADFRTVDETYDFIISNPPFFTNGELAPLRSRAIARHSGELSPYSLVAFAANHLAPHGSVALIAPSEISEEIIAKAAINRLHLERRVDVATSARRGITRTLLQFSKSPCRLPAPGTLTVGSDDYNRLTRPFYLHL